MFNLYGDWAQFPIPNNNFNNIIVNYLITIKFQLMNFKYHYINFGIYFESIYLNYLIFLMKYIYKIQNPYQIL